MSKLHSSWGCARVKIGSGHAIRFRGFLPVLHWRPAVPARPNMPI